MATSGPCGVRRHMRQLSLSSAYMIEATPSVERQYRGGSRQAPHRLCRHATAGKPRR